MASTKFGRFGDNAPAAKASFASPKAGGLSKTPASGGYSRPGGASPAFSPPAKFTGQQPTESTMITQQVAQWDFEMDSLDKQQEKLLNDQWLLLRTQIGSLMGALSEVKSELADLKNNVITKEMEAVIENMVSAHDGHDKNHSSILDRLDYIENVMGESVDKHADHAQHKASMDARMEFLEGLVGDNADKHMKGLNDLADAMDGCAKTEHHATMEERVNYLESFLGESADKHSKDLQSHAQGWEDHKATMETRLEFLEALQGDSADKHSKDIEAAMKKMGDLHKAVAGCAKSEHHASMEQRVKYLEAELGESADNHDSHKTTMETRLEYLESLLGDSAEKHAKEINAAKGKLNDLHAAIQSCAKTEHHSSLEKRMEYLENALGESADKQTLSDHKAGIEGRLEYVEALLGDASSKSMGEIEASKAKIASLEKSMKSLVSGDSHGALDQRVNYLERCLGEVNEKSTKEVIEFKNLQNTYKKTMEQRLEYMENMLSANSENKAKDVNEKIQFTEARIRDLAQKVDQGRSSTDGIKSSFEQRMTYLESMISENYGSGVTNRVDQRIANVQEETRAQHESFKNSIHQSMKEQLDLQHSAIMSQSSQMKELWDREAHSRQSSVENYRQLLQQERTARDHHNQQLDERMVFLEQRLNFDEMTLGQEPPKMISYVTRQPSVVAAPTMIAAPTMTVVSNGAMSPLMPQTAMSPRGSLGTGTLRTPVLSAVQGIGTLGTMQGYSPYL